MFLNGLVTGVHSSADDIGATAKQYSVDIRARQRNNKSGYFSPIGKLVLSHSHLGCTVERFGSGKMLEMNPALAPSVILEGLNVPV